MAGALLVPPHVRVCIEAKTRHWDEWVGDKHFGPPFKQILCRSMHQAASKSVLPFDRVVLTVGAEDHLARFAAFTTTSDESPRRSITLSYDTRYNRGRPPDLSELLTLLLRDIMQLRAILKPSELDIHLAEHVLATSELLFALFRKHPEVTKLAVGSTHASNRLIPYLYVSDALRPREVAVCTADFSELDVATLVAGIIRRAQTTEHPALKRLVICLHPDDAGFSLDAFAALPPQVEVDITRGCPVCHRVVPPDELELFHPSTSLMEYRLR